MKEDKRSLEPPPSEDQLNEASGPKVPPPVAPKPAWFNPSLKKRRDNQDQMRQANHSAEVAAAGVSRSLGGRSSSGAATMSIRQKIHSFETFSSPEAPDKRAGRRSTTPSNSLSLKEKQCTSPSHPPPASDRDDGKSKQNLSDETQSERSASVLTEDVSAPPSAVQSVLHEESERSASVLTEDVSAPPSAVQSVLHEESERSASVLTEDVSAPPSAVQSVLHEDSDQTEAESPEDQISGNHLSNDVPFSDTISDSVMEESSDRKVQQSNQEAEVKEQDLTTSTEAQPSSVRVDQQKEVKHSDQTSGEDCGEAPMAAPPSAEGRPPRSQEEEHIGKIIAFSNQVSQAIMRSHPTSYQGNPPSQSLMDPPAREVDNPSESELSTVCTNKGFSVSLATLRECTIEQGRENLDQATCLHSVMSGIPSQEIRKMIEEAKTLEEETLKQLVDIHVVILHKEEGAGLGFSIAGGCDLENKAPTVHKVFPCGLAAQEGTIQKGDEVLSINGQTLRGVKHTDATAVLRQARNQTLAVVVICKRADEEGKDGGSRRGEEPSAPKEQGVPISVDLEKGAGGIGFSLEGGKGSIQGDRPLVINRIFKGGAAEQSGLQCGDEVLQVQGAGLQDMTRFEAWNMIKALPEGPVSLVIRRRAAAEE
ncbi:pro-interleukin-16 isoform X2 [Cyprinodon tularosa]|uniref:pro-interleukin-16 isoform X2 n=1 Tax=Cyprinodon tularosa TaxID=77115 RepID=UPI0018E1E5D6|nr:pro-interleukin-16 isoform X2 [Cyprinodon tularosa]